MDIILPSLRVGNRTHTEVLMHVCIRSAKPRYVLTDASITLQLSG